ncbi:protein kinase domain-containing protein [Spiroplasma platyhelix]|uniref:non-specific serine/threonine protein kinase n=1 Tax=Spiroplasma platyhelix PALS-1 TaxID=1276218 RepID=A0A846TRZ7_9MOLU|nr:protein kinase [Spiroplasma platyhelix]MBE4703902.1 Serine/threonine-protein kinase PrkC [Spiroplasma platyhelix PALS-1]NKE38275.1 serine/threonine protein kinase [Spiroplasma platyhelix PALS-1]UJB29160.1 serine/threonine protein kinase [Spiroplasma platyhelix PALS-1]
MEMNQKLNNRYQIINKIGSGGMAKVYEARDLYLNRNVAVKIINLDTNKIDNLSQERFIQEIKAVSRIRHPNVILVYDIFIDQKNWCLVLELLKGKTLKEYLSNLGVLSINETLNIMQKILLGVNACHQAGIVHRDLKPDNILLNDNGAIKVLDFGIAMIDGYEVKKHAHQVVGTMKYIAPEVVKFQAATIQSDVYSLGIILYELLVGKPPFIHKNPQLLANKHIKEPMPLIRDYNPTIPQSLENIIMKATNKNPAERYATIQEMSQDLATCLSHTRKNEKPIVSKQKMLVKTKEFQLNKLNFFFPFFLKKWFLILLSFIIVLIVVLAVVIVFYLK